MENAPHLSVYLYTYTTFISCTSLLHEQVVLTYSDHLHNMCYIHVVVSRFKGPCVFSMWNDQLQENMFVQRLREFMRRGGRSLRLRDSSTRDLIYEVKFVRVSLLSFKGVS